MLSHFNIRRRLWRPIFSLIAGGSLVAYLLFHLSMYLFGEDQATFAVIADGILRGEVPYRDLLDTKPPVIFGLYAVAHAILGSNQAAIRLIEAGALLTLLPAFILLSKRFVGVRSAGWIAFPLAILWHVQLGFWHTGQAESFAGILLIWAVVALSHDSPRSSRLCAGIAGALFTVSGLLKFPLGGGIVPCFLLAAWNRWSATRRLTAPVSILLSGAIGALLTGGLIILPFVWSGALSDLLWVFGSVVAGYPSIRIPAPFPLLLGKALAQPLLQMATIALPCLVLLLVLEPHPSRERKGVLMLLAAALPQSVGVAMQGKFFVYHSAGVLPFLALLSGWGLWKALWLLRRRAIATLVLATILACLQVLPEQRFWRFNELRIRAWLDPQQRAALENRMYSSINFDRRDVRRVANWLRINTDEHSKILVWGFNPSIYFLSGRAPASRFIGNHPLRFAWSQQEAERLMLQDLERTSVSAAIIVHDDPTSWVTGHRRDSADELEHLPSLQQYLEQNLASATTIGSFELLVPPNAPARVPIFDDGFESGDLSAWTQRRAPAGRR